MVDYFHDTSALGKHYHAEVGTAKVDGLLAEESARHFISRLTLTEMLSTFAGKVRTGVLDASDYAVLCRRFLTDVTLRRFHVVRLTGFHYQEAERLIRRHGPSHRFRSLDSLQLSVALDLRGRGMLDHLVCADRGFIDVARAEGLSVIDPEGP